MHHVRLLGTVHMDPHLFVAACFARRPGTESHEDHYFFSGTLSGEMAGLHNLWNLCRPLWAQKALFPLLAGRRSLGAALWDGADLLLAPTPRPLCGLLWHRLFFCIRRNR